MIRSLRKRSYTWVFLLVILVIANSAHAAPTCGIAEQVFPQLEKIRGLSLKRKVPCTVQDKAEVMKFIKTETADPTSLARIKQSELVLKKLLVLKPKVDYISEFTQLMTDQIGGYYDPKRKKYVMAAWLPDAVQPTVAAHELTHALQDQYFNLQQVIDEEKFTNDQLMARTALVEGDATLAMQDYVRLSFGGKPVRDDENVDALIFQTVVGMRATTSASQTVPNMIMSLLVFPYTSGLRFAHSLAKNGGYKAIDAAFVSPPCNTSEILHPEKYKTRIAHRATGGKSECQSIVQPKNQDDSFTDSMGEFFLANWLKEVVGLNKEAFELASKWQGDRIEVDKNNRFTWQIQFEDESASTSLEKLMHTFLADNHLGLDKKGALLTISDQ